MRWTQKPSLTVMLKLLHYKPSINSKIENIFCRLKLAIINIGNNPKEKHYHGSY